MKEKIIIGILVAYFLGFLWLGFVLNQISSQIAFSGRLAAVESGLAQVVSFINQSVTQTK